MTFDEYAEINQGRRGPPHPMQIACATCGGSRIVPIGDGYSVNDCPACRSLWAIHIKGPDDIYAMPSKEEAILQADIFNRMSITGQTVVTVVQWPYTAEAHAASMLENMEKQ